MAKKKLTIEDVLVPREEIPYEVPKNWCWVKLGNIVELERGITFPASAKKSEMEEGLIPCLRTANVQHILEIDDLIYVDRSHMKKNTNKLVREGDIIMSTANSLELVGKLAIVENINREMTFGGFVLNIRNKGYIDNKYLFYYLRGMFVLGEFQKIASQTTNIANINAKKLEDINIVIPPLGEQKRIVNRIESLFDKVDRAAGLVEEARDDFDKRIPPLAEQERIVNRIESLFDKVDKAVCLVAEAREGFEKRRAAILERAFCGELTSFTPNYMKLKECGKFINDKKEPEKEDYYLGLEHFSSGYGIIGGSSGENVKSTKSKFKSGDILYGRLRPYLDKHDIVDRDGICSTDILIFRCNEDISINKYINYFMRINDFKSYAIENSKGINLPRVSAKVLEELVIPIFTLDEQIKIINILDNVFSKEFEIDEITNIDKNIELIKKSILAKAFRGELGSNDVDEESSIELLKNIIK